MFRSLRSMIRSLTRKRSRPSKPAARMMAYRKFGLQLEHLEAREVPATFVNYAGGTLSQDFDSLTQTASTALTNTNGLSQSLDDAPFADTNLDGWAVQKISGTGTTFNFLAGTGSANTGAPYSFGVAGTGSVNDRALGSLGSGGAIPGLGVTVRNTTGATITSVNLTFFSEQWRQGDAAPDNEILAFEYQTAAAGAVTIGTATGWTADATGNLISAAAPSPTTANAALDGNNAANRSQRTVALTGLNWVAGGDLVLRWNDVNDGGNDDGLAIDDFTLSTTATTDAVISFGAANYTVVEGTGGTTNATVSLTRSGNLASEVTVLVTTSPGTPAPTPGAGPGFGAGEDYITQSTTVTFAAGSATPTVPFAVAINPDTAIEANEQITITLSAPTVVTGGGTASIGGSTTAPLTILDDDAAAPAGLLLNEIYINPPGTDTPNEFVEIRNTTGSPVSLNNVYYVVVEGDDIAATAGTADLVVDLTGQTIPANGILVIKSSLSTLNFGGATQFNVAAFDSGTGAIENGANTHFLVFSASPIVQGTDYDSTNDGVIDAGTALANATALDRIGYFEASSGEFTYGPTIPRFANVTPDSISRFAANTTANSAGAWFGGAIVSSLPLTYAETIALDGLPLGAVVTPGAANYATPAAGQIRFASAGFSGSEGGNITVTLTRTGGTTGAVNAVVTAAELSNAFPGTESFRATNGSDFTASSAPVANLSLTWSGGVVTVQALTHGLSVGDGVAIAGATDGYNGGFVVASVPNANEFTYALANNPGTALVTGTSQQGILVSWAAGDGADKTFNLAVPQDTDAEGNEAFDLRIAGVSGGAVTTIRTAAGVVNADDLATAAPVVYLNEVKVDAAGSDGPFEYIELRGAPNQVLTNVYVVSVEGDSQIAGITGATWVTGTPTGTATLTVADSLGIAVGESITVAGVVSAGPGSFNGTFTVTAVTATTIAYALGTDPGAYDATASGTNDTVTGPQSGKPGTFDRVFNLNDIDPNTAGNQTAQLGSNGLLIIRGANGHASVDPATTVVIDTRLDEAAGVLENGTVSHLVVYSPAALTQATTPAGGPYELASDYDQDNNGSLEQLPAGAVLLDGIGWNDGGIGDVSYGTFLTSGVSAFPPNMAATRVLESTTPFSVNGFRQGELLFTTNAELAYEFANANAPAGGALTPGGANFSQVANPNGTFSFTTAVVNTTEGANVVLTVQRLGGSTGAVTVPYTLANLGTTTAADYGTPTPGSPLSWADGDSAPQTITIPIVDDPDAEGAEQFTVTLGTPTGGATLGSPVVATVTIAASDVVVATNVRINEVDSDTPGTDAAEFIELYDGGVGNTSLTGLVVVLFNGATDTSYAAFDLDGLTTNAQGYFVLGNTGVTGVGLTFAGNLLQNGADAVALYVGDATSFPTGTAVTATGIVDAVVYDTADADDTGLISVLTPGQAQIDEAANSLSADQSIARVPNGGTALNTTTYVTQAPTPNASNVGAPDTTPPTIAPANFVDNVSGGPVNVNTAVTYTLTFSEDIIDAGGGALTAADLDNAGTSAVTIGTITETSPGVFTVVVTPTSAGTLQLRIPTGASITDLAGNPLAVPVADDTTITVNAVVNNGTFQFSAATYTTNEGVGTFSVTVTRTGGSTGTVTVPFTVTAGTATSPGDYAVVSTSPISFADGQLSQVITFSVVDDGSGESPETFTVDLQAPSAGALGATTSATVTVTDPLLLVSSLTATNSGVVVQFNRAFDTTTLNLYDAAGGTLGAADVTVAGTTGSLVVLPGNQLYFVKTGAEIAAGTYATAIRSAADGLKDIAGVLLDGDGNATAGGNFAGNFTVAAYTDKVVRVGDFARGQTQTVSIPLTISDGASVTAVDAELIYDPALLDFGTGTITSPVAGWSGSFNPNFATLPNGLRVAKFNVFGATALTGTNLVFANIPATVPAAAPYANKEVLRLQNTFWNESNVIRTDDAVHVAAYFGDATGNGGLSGQDASLVSQLAAGSGTGFVAYQNADPVLIADATLNGGLSGQDASLISQKAAGATIASIPDPGPANPAQGGPDPRMYFGTFTAAQGQTVTVPMRFNVAEVGGISGVQSMDVAGTFDAARFSVSNVRYKPGSPWAAAGWVVTANVDNAAGTLRIVTFSPTAPGLTFAQDYDDESLLFDFFVKPTAPVGSSPLNIAQNVASTITAVNEGAFTLLPAPTNATNDANVDGTFTVTAATTSANLFWAGANVAAGATFTTQLRVSNNGTANWTATSIDSASTFDPTKLQITSVTAGSLLTGAPTPWTVTANIDNANGTLRVVTFASNTPGITVIPGQVGDVLNVTFQVAPTATGSTYIDLRPVVNPTTTAINEGAVTLSPLPANATNQAEVDAVITIAVNPNKPPFNAVPAATQQVLWNSAQQVATPNTVVFSTANGNAITVTDGNGVVNVTTTLSVGTTGTLTLGSTAGVTVTGNGTGSVTVAGTTADVTAALDGLTYQPNAGYHGDVLLTVATNDGGNSGFGGPLTDTRTVVVQVVGLFVSEVFFNDGSNSTAAGNLNEYIEVFSTVPNYTIPSDVYFVGVEGDAGTGANNPGLVQDIFRLGGFITGANGYLALLQKAQQYGAANVLVPAGTTVANSSTGATGNNNSAGFGNGAATSRYSVDNSGTTFITNVHSGQSATAPTGTRPDATGEFNTDIENGSVSFLLVQSATPPAIGNDIDADNNGVADGAVFGGWNVFDSVAALDGGATDRGYAAITFRNGGTGTGTGNLVDTTFNPGYVGRVLNFKGSSSADWLASSVPAGSGGAFTLGTTTNPAFDGQSLNHVGGVNAWAPRATVTVNDGSSDQRSQVSQLLVGFTGPAFLDLNATAFAVYTSAGTAVSINVTPLDGTDNLDGTFSDVTQVKITFNVGVGTFAFAAADPFGNTVGLTDGNFFLKVFSSQVSVNGVNLDGDGDGFGGGNQIEQFHRLFGDTNGDRAVDGVDNALFNTTRNKTNADGEYLWFLDADLDGDVFNDDRTQFRNRLWTYLPPSTTPPSILP